MRQFTILITLLLFLSCHSSGQKLNPDTKNEAIGLMPKTDSLSTEYKFICRTVVTDAKFENGPDDWNTYLQRNLNNEVPKLNGAPAGKYTVRINFVVSKEGKVTTIKATTNFGYGMENEAIRIISGSPKWTPATQNGRLVNDYLVQLITFDVCKATGVDLITSNCKVQMTEYV